MSQHEVGRSASVPRPRVLQVVLGLAPGGTERLVIELVNRLRPEVGMAVCCLDHRGQWGDELREAGVPVYELGRADGFHPLLGRRIAAAAAEQGANLIHAHHYSPFVYSAIAKLWRPSLKVLFTEHGRLSDAAPSSKRRLANALLSRVPHRVFTVSGDLKEHIVAEGFPESAVDVLYNGIDVGPHPGAEARRRIRAQLGLHDDTLVVGTVARLDPVKNLDVLVEAIARLAPRLDVALLVVGDGDERQRLEQTAVRTGASSVVRFLGHRDDARELLAGCDVYANSSISEGVSLTILEAMAAGLPVVATRVGGSPEVLDATCARLVPARNPDAMAEALLGLARDAAARAILGRAGRLRVEAHFTLGRMVQEYRAAYLLASRDA